MVFTQRIRQVYKLSALAIIVVLNLPGFVLAQSLDDLHKLAVKEGGTLFRRALKRSMKQLLDVFPAFRFHCPGRGIATLSRESSRA